MCLPCRTVPSDLKKDMTSIKCEVAEMKQFTLSVVKAIEGLSTKFETNFASLKHRLTSMSRQINSKELCVSESIETLQTTTDSLKTTLDQKSCQIFNKTTAIFEKVKLHSEEFKTFSKYNSQNRLNVEKADRQITEQEDNTTQLEWQILQVLKNKETKG